MYFFLLVDKTFIFSQLTVGKSLAFYEWETQIKVLMLLINQVFLEAKTSLGCN